VGRVAAVGTRDYIPANAGSSAWASVARGATVS